MSWLGLPTPTCRGFGFLGLGVLDLSTECLTRTDQVESSRVMSSWNSSGGRGPSSVALIQNSQTSEQSEIVGVGLTHHAAQASARELPSGQLSHNYGKYWKDPPILQLASHQLFRLAIFNSELLYSLPEGTLSCVPLANLFKRAPNLATEPRKWLRDSSDNRSELPNIGTSGSVCSDWPSPNDVKGPSWNDRGQKVPPEKRPVPKTRSLWILASRVLEVLVRCFDLTTNNFADKKPVPRPSEPLVEVQRLFKRHWKPHCMRQFLQKRRQLSSKGAATSIAIICHHRKRILHLLTRFFIKQRKHRLLAQRIKTQNPLNPQPIPCSG